MACSRYGKGKCKDGFPVTTGCWATGVLGKNTAGGVRCIDEEWCGKEYSENGGKPVRVELTIVERSR